ITYGYEGITYAAAAGADIISCSWTGSASTSTGQLVSDYVQHQGMLLVAGAGNNGLELSLYPASFPGVISVAAVDDFYFKSSYSNFGTSVSICSPGNSIRSTITNNSYTSLSGTSMATPLVAGLLGLMKSYEPLLSAAQLKTCLLTKATSIDALNPSYAGKL